MFSMEQRFIEAAQRLKQRFGKARVKRALKQAGISPKKVKVFYRSTTVTRSQLKFP